MQIALCLIDNGFFFQNIESGSRATIENHYAESVELSVKPAEEQPLLADTPPLTPRVEDDGGSSPGVSTPHAPDHGTHTLPTYTTDNSSDDPTAEECPPPLPPRLMDDGASTPHSEDQSTPHQVTSDNGAGDPTYASVLTTIPNTVSQPAATEKVSYEDIQISQNEQVHVWFTTHLQMFM